MDSLVEGFRLGQTTQTAVVGSGGKTTAVFHLARRLPAPVWVSASAHMGVWQLGLADRHIVLAQAEDLEFAAAGAAVTLFTGPIDAAKERSRGVEAELLQRLHRRAMEAGRALVIEADGARRKMLKAPAEHEPPIPTFVDNVIVAAGLSAIGQPLDEETVYGAERFARLGALAMGAPVEPDALGRVLAHPLGGLKNVPAGARRLALLNQVDALGAGHSAGVHEMAQRLLAAYDAVALAALSPGGEQAGVAARVDSVYEPAAAIILAAGAARRMGAPKLLLPWRGETVIRTTARLALACGAQQAIVVIGSHADEMERALEGLPVQIVYNPDWQSGQASSLATGLQATTGNTGRAVFLLGDQPQIPAALVRALLLRHAQSHPAALAPAVGGRRANPVVFDRITFPDLLALQGDEGGRQIMQRYPLELLDWDDARILWDIDTPEDYARFME